VIVAPQGTRTPFLHFGPFCEKIHIWTLENISSYLDPRGRCRDSPRRGDTSWRCKPWHRGPRPLGHCSMRWRGRGSMVGAIGHGTELGAEICGAELGAMAYGADHASKIPSPLSCPSLLPFILSLS
jgi:hypothetical protein